MTHIIDSLLRFPNVAGSLHLRRQRVGHIFRIEHRGDFSVFRETENSQPADAPPVVVVIGFRLKAIGAQPLLHWLFQRLCIMTTPFWAGMAGFRVKLWMVNMETKEYGGVYEWRGEDQAQRYVDFLLPVLGFFSKKDSIWFRLFPDIQIDNYLADRQQ